MKISFPFSIKFLSLNINTVLTHWTLMSGVDNCICITCTYHGSSGTSKCPVKHLISISMTSRKKVLQKPLKWEDPQRKAKKEEILPHLKHSFATLGVADKRWFIMKHEAGTGGANTPEYAASCSLCCSDTRVCQRNRADSHGWDCLQSLQLDFPELSSDALGNWGQPLAGTQRC